MQLKKTHESNILLTLWTVSIVKQRDIDCIGLEMIDCFNDERMNEWVCDLQDITTNKQTNKQTDWLNS